MTYIPWSVDPRYLVGEDGSVLGPTGAPVGRLCEDGYRRISYRDPATGRRHTTTAHVMVCETFHGPRPDGLQVRHRNNDRADCRAANLRWGTPAQNMADQVGHRTAGKRLTNEDVQAIRAEPGTPRAELARRFGVTPGTISHIRTGHTWRNLPPVTTGAPSR
jgi:hypothetical protein